MSALYSDAAGVVPTTLPTDDDVLTINFVEDGLSAFGKVWLRGEELSVRRDSPEWEATCDRTGRSWMELSEREQFARWGAVQFREGLWAGRSLSEIDDPALSDEDRALLEKAEQERAEALNEAKKAPESPSKARKRTSRKPAAPKADKTPEVPAVETVESADGEPNGDDFLDRLNED